MADAQALQRVETPAACLTLTRTATLAITAAGTTITWQAETRGQGITWSGADVTIPTTGFYTFSLIYTASGSHTGTMRLLVNTINVLSMPSDGLGSVRHAYNMVRYFSAGDVIQFSVISNPNTTVQINAEGTTNESPFLHIVQLTGSQT